MKRTLSRLSCVQLRSAGAIGLVLIVVGLMLTGLVNTDYCDPELEPEDDLALQYRIRGDRCEGFYKMEVSSDSPPFEIVGITHGPIEYPTDPDALIELTCPWAGGNVVQIQAVAIPPYTYYQMDAGLEPGQLLSWSLEVAHAGGLPSSDIGLLAWLMEAEGEGSKRVFVPVSQARGTAAGEDEAIVLVLRPRESVELVQWRIRYERDGVLGEFGGYTMLDPSNYTAGSPIHIILPAGGGQRALIEVEGMNAETGEWDGWSGTFVAGEGPDE